MSVLWDFLPGFIPFGVNIDKSGKCTMVHETGDIPNLSNELGAGWGSRVGLTPFIVMTTVCSMQTFISFPPRLQICLIRELIEDCVGDVTRSIRTMSLGLRIMMVLFLLETSIPTALIIIMNTPLECISNGQYQFYSLPV